MTSIRKSARFIRGRNQGFSPLLLASAVFCTAPASAHHSYADYDRNERFVLTGTITDVHWGNPHILLTVSDGEQDMRIEWVTTTGASITGVEQDQFITGDSIIVTGSRNRNPEHHIMTLIKTLEMPDKHWQWVSPSLKRK